MPVTLSQTLVVGASKEEKSKSALILILHAQELPAANAEPGAAAPKAASTAGKPVRPQSPRSEPEKKP